MIVSVRKRRAPSRTHNRSASQPHSPLSPSTIQAPVEGVEVVFPDGLFGLTNCHKFLLTKYHPEDGGASPFFLMQCQDENVSLPVLDPRLLVADYTFSIAPEVLDYLQARSVTDLSILTIVTVRDRMEDMTMNLQGPLLMNVAAHLGLQMIVEHFPVRYPLFVPADEKQTATE